MTLKPKEYVAIIVLSVSAIVLLSVLSPIVRTILVRLLLAPKIWSLADLLPYGRTPEDKYFFARLFWYGTVPGVGTFTWKVFPNFRLGNREQQLYVLLTDLGIFFVALIAAFFAYEKVSVNRHPLDIAGLVIGPVTGILSSVVGIWVLGWQSKNNAVKFLIVVSLSAVPVAVVAWFFPEVRFEWQIM